MPWLTPVYPVAPFIVLIMLNQSSARALLIPFFIAVASYDIGAYFIGTQWGYHKLCPHLSPGKSWQGVGGGLLFSCVATGLFFATQGHTVPVSSLLVFCLCLTIPATIGDLFESFLKRRVGIKDAGFLLPGHGGLLDRFDSILGAIIILYPCQRWISNLISY
jgi:phosphatidate cytidylyltransferase